LSKNIIGYVYTLAKKQQTPDSWYNWGSNWALLDWRVVLNELENTRCYLCPASGVHWAGDQPHNFVKSVMEAW